MSTEGMAPLFRIRPYGAHDRESVLSLAERLTTDIAAWLDAAAVHAVIQDGIETVIGGTGSDHMVFVAEPAGGGCAGFVTVERQMHWSGTTQAYVGEIVVAEGIEGLGAGRALLAAAEVWAQEQHCRILALDTNVTNERARRVYERAGFVADTVRLVKVLSDTPQEPDHDT